VAGATITLKVPGAGSLGLVAAQGLLLTLADSDNADPARKRALSTVRGGLGLAEATTDKDVQRALAEYVADRLGPQSGDGAAPPPKAAAAAPKARGGGKAKTAAKAKGQAGNDQFEQQHPRGRGGVWIKKGAGMSSPDPQVAQLQKRLQQLGYGPGAADGKFGNLTEQSVIRFQQTYGLQPTGQVDPATLQTLQSPPAQTLAQVQAQNRAAAALPNAQGQLPHAPGGGVASTGGGAPAATQGAAHAAGTQANSLNTADPQAVRQFQAAHGLKADGIVGPNTDALMRGLGVTASNTPAASSAGSSRAGGTASSRPAGSTSGSGRAASRSSGGSRSSASKTLQLGAGVGGNANPQVKTIQTALEQLGYDLGGPDGRFGPQTKKAVVKLQRKYGLAPDGIVGPRTQKLIQRLVQRAGKNQKGKITDAASSALLQSATDEQLRHRLAEVREADSVHDFRQDLHPRDRRGEFIAKEIANLHDGEAKVIHGVQVARKGLHYDVGQGENWARHLTLKKAALATLATVNTVASISQLLSAEQVESPVHPLTEEVLDTFHHLHDRLGRFAHRLDTPPPPPKSYKQRFPNFHAEVSLSDRMGPANVATALDSATRKLAGMSDAQLSALSPDEIDTVYSILHRSIKPTHAKQSARLLKAIRTHQMAENFLEEFFGGLHHAYDEAKHPRGRGGKWAPGMGAGAPVSHGSFGRIHATPHVDFSATDRKLAGVTAASHPHASRPNITPERIRSASAPERKILLQHARDHVADLEFQSEGQHIQRIGRPGPGPARSVTSEQITSARLWEKQLRRAAEGLREELQVIPGLAHRLEEATTKRIAAQASKAPAQIIAARAVEVAIAGQMMEGNALSAQARKSSATVVRKNPDGSTDYKFPIPDKGHARAALAYLDRSDLSDAEKKKVKSKAKAKLAEAELLESLEDSDWEALGLTEAADSLAKASSPEPWSTSKTSNWVARAGGLPPYIQHISHDLHEKRGMPESQAIAMAIGICKRWCRGGGNVDANTKAAACKAIAEWEAKKAKAHAS
jgi:peptidoglycan hydrolase-like protein with peptidoglycan-binding domain